VEKPKIGIVSEASLDSIMTAGKEIWYKWKRVLRKETAKQPTICDCAAGYHFMTHREAAMRQFSVKTQARSQIIDITAQVRSILRESRAESGICIVFVPHTTAAVTINENADPDVPRDVLAQLDKTIPFRGDYLHSEGNSAAHIKASLFGASETVLIEGGNLVLGTWQSIFFCEFDGPRTRQVYVQILPGG
jgi:secondary thiamine-phosphate synthase enzyme